MGGTQIEVGEKILNDHKIPSFRFPERAVKALGAMHRWQQWRLHHPKVAHSFTTLSPKVQKNIRDVVSVYKGSSVPGSEAAQAASLAGINVPDGAVVGSHDEAKKLAAAIGYPVVLKISSRSALHKTEMHGVTTGIQTHAELTFAFDNLLKVVRKTKDKTAVIELQKQITGGVEVIVGVKRDPSFGLVLMLGAGGILTELVADRNLAVADVSEDSLDTLIRHSKVGKLLMGYRGSKPYTIRELVKLLVRLRAVAESVPEIREIEINPVIVTHNRALAVDTKIIVQ